MTTETQGAVLTDEQLDQYQQHAEQAVMIGTGFTLEIIASHRAISAERDRLQRVVQDMAAATGGTVTFNDDGTAILAFPPDTAPEAQS